MRSLALILTVALAGPAMAARLAPVVCPDPAHLQWSYDQALRAGERAFAAGHLDEAEHAYRQAMACFEGSAPFDAFEQSRGRLVRIYARQNRLAALEAEVTAQLARCEREHGRADPSVASPLAFLALVADERGRYDESIRYTERILSLPLPKNALGPDGVTLSMLAFWRFASGDTAGGLAERDRAMNNLMELMTPDPRWEAVWVAEWGWFGAAAGDLVDAREAFSRAIRQLGKLLGANHPDLATLWDAQAAVLDRLHQPREAAQARARAAAIWRRFR